MNDKETVVPPTTDMDDFSAEFPASQPVEDAVVSDSQTPESPVTDQSQPEKKPRKKSMSLVMILVLVVVVLGLVVTVIGLIYALGMASPGSSQNEVIVSPSPIPVNARPLEASFSAQLDALESQMEAADPAVIDLKPPQLDFDIRL